MRRRRAERGAALLIVLWMLLLLSLLAAAFLSMTRADLAIARNDIESAQARALADAGVTRAVLAVGDADPERRWHADGTRYAWRFGGGTVSVTIVGESGKIDLNTAPEPVLESLFRSVGADDAASARLADAALARRAAAPEPQMAAAGGTIDPGAPAFAAIEDLGSLPGIAASVLHRALPLVTVYSGTTTVDPTSAPRGVLLALPGASAAEVDQFIVAREAQAAGTGPALAPPPGLAPFLASAASSAVTITADARTGTGARFVREAVVFLRDPRGRPFVVKRWAQNLAPE
jgi:general secretion pathway protein K